MIGAAVAVVVCVLAVVFLWKKDIVVTVRGQTWSRTIGIEQLSPERKSSWCDQKPYDAYNVTRSREVRSHRQIPDGQTCTTERKSRGDGSYTNERVCRTKYRSEPIYDDKCYYTVDRWSEQRAVTAQGTIADTPHWPTLPPLRRGSTIGSEREGQHRARYAVALQGPKDVYDCAYDEARWRSYTQGQQYPMKIGVVTGFADCDSLNHK